MTQMHFTASSLSLVFCEREEENKKIMKGKTIYEEWAHIIDYSIHVIELL